jgi:hypothetical protein
MESMVETREEKFWLVLNQRRTVTYLDCPSPVRDLRSEQANALPVPPASTFFVGGAFGASAGVTQIFGEGVR